MKIAKIKGIEIKLHLSTLLIVFLVGFYAADFYYSLNMTAPLIDLILVGLINGIIILISILVHELTHSLVANRYGLKVSEIELYLFGGVSKIEQEPKTPKSEFIISLLGPVSSLVIGFLFLLPIWLIPIQFPIFIYVTLLYSGTSNIILGFFNLIPAYPIDGGRILRAALWQKRHDILSATKSASRIGSIMAYCLMGYGFYQILFFGFFNGLWMIIIASFLNNQSRHAYLQTLHEITFSKIKVKEMITPIKLEIPFTMTINDAIKNYFMIYKKSYFPVVQNNNIVGIIHMDDLRKIPVNERSNFIVGYAMKNISLFPTISENENGKVALNKLMQSTMKQQIVVAIDSNNKIIGFIGEDELASTIKFSAEQI
jgi:Zn-dependent protease